MDIFHVLKLIGGLSLFLIGLMIIGESTRKKTGGRIKEILKKLTTNKYTAFLTGLFVTACIQSSYATIAMLIGFVNSGIISLSQSIGVIIGANVGTTVTAWFISLCDISGDNVFVILMKPVYLGSILAFIGIIKLKYCKSNKSISTAKLFVGCAALIFGMTQMSEAVSTLNDSEKFRSILFALNNPLYGILIGFVVTAIIQSSSASVGILQALCVTNHVTYAIAIPIIMGQNIGACVTAFFTTSDTNKDAKCVAVINLLFNVLATVITLGILITISCFYKFKFLDTPTTFVGIATVHSLFNILFTIIILPMSSLLEKLAYLIVINEDEKEMITEFDQRLLVNTSIALEHVNSIVKKMGKIAIQIVFDDVSMIRNYDVKELRKMKEDEERVKYYKNKLSDFIIDICRGDTSEEDIFLITKFSKLIEEYEIIAVHGGKILRLIEKMHSEEIKLTDEGKEGALVLCDAVSEIANQAYYAFINDDIKITKNITPLRDVIEKLRIDLRNAHIRRICNGACKVSAGYVWPDILSQFERVAAHCDNISNCLRQYYVSTQNVVEEEIISEIVDKDYEEMLNIYSEKYEAG